MSSPMVIHHESVPPLAKDSDRPVLCGRIKFCSGTAVDVTASELSIELAFPAHSLRWERRSSTAPRSGLRVQPLATVRVGDPPSLSKTADVVEHFAGRSHA